MPRSAPVEARFATVGGSVFVGLFLRFCAPSFFRVYPSHPPLRLPPLSGVSGAYGQIPPERSTRPPPEGGSFQVSLISMVFFSPLIARRFAPAVCQSEFAFSPSIFPAPLLSGGPAHPSRLSTQDGSAESYREDALPQFP